MIKKIDDATPRFLIPGFDVSPPAVDDLEESEESVLQAPYGSLPQGSEIARFQNSPGFLGRNRVAPEPNRVDPPPRPASLISEGVSSASPESMLRQMRGTLARNQEPSEKVERMINVMSSYTRSVNRIRARALGEGTE